VQIPVYGHAADGNLHATPLKSLQQSDEQWEAMLPGLLSEIYRITVRLGGTISGEHGIGHKRKDFSDLVDEPDTDRYHAADQAGHRPQQHPQPGKDRCVVAASPVGPLYRGAAP